MSDELVTCPACGGKGDCKFCNGTGKVTEQLKNDWHRLRLLKEWSKDVVKQPTCPKKKR